MAGESSRSLESLFMNNDLDNSLPMEYPLHQQGSNGTVQQHGPANGQQANVQDANAFQQSQLLSSQSVSNLTSEGSITQPDWCAMDSSVQNGGQSTAASGQGSQETSAPRLYHRTVLQHEITKKSFFAAKSQNDTQEMASAAYELESISRKIRALLCAHRLELGGYSKASHLAAVWKWQAEHEMWGDTARDIQIAHVLANAPSSSNYRETSMRKERGEWEQQSGQDQGGYPIPPYLPMSLQQRISPPRQIPQQQQQQFLPSQLSYPMRDLLTMRLPRFQDFIPLDPTLE